MYLTVYGHLPPRTFAPSYFGPLLGRVRVRVRNRARVREGVRVGVRVRDRVRFRVRFRVRDRFNVRGANVRGGKSPGTWRQYG